jgi:4-hydroxy-tetrahydrodipicolinate synthase
MTPPIRGSLTPLVTPFAAGEVDYESFASLVDRQLAHGSHGVTVAGTTGEPASLSLAEREHLFETAVDAAAGRGVVLAGTGTSELRDTLTLTAAAKRSGATAALVVTPAFVNPDQAGLQHWFEVVADAAEIPVVLYDIPGRSGVALSLETTERLSRHGNVIGVKLARPDLVHASNVLAACGPDFGVYSGVEALCYPMLALGGAGHVSATGNLFPTEVAQLADAVFAGDHDTARELHFRLLDVNEAVFFQTNPVPVKAMLAMIGLISPEVRPPLRAADAELERRLEKILAAHGLTPIPAEVAH